MTSYNIELVPAKLVPFDWSTAASSIASDTIAGPVQSNAASGGTVSPSGQTMTAQERSMADFAATAQGIPLGFTVQSNPNAGINGFNISGGSIYSVSHPLYPLTLTGGLVFPYNPIISESLGSRYDTTELVHANEGVHTFRNNENVRITLSECIWTSETFDQAVYTLGVIHFFRSYRLMDFGRGKSGRPPSPMWFSAYGNYLYTSVPVLVERVEMSFPADIDYVGVPNPGTSAYAQQQLQYTTAAALGSVGTVLSQTGDFTWVPIRFTVGAISMVVQNSVKYWRETFDLAAFKGGKLVGIR